MSASKQKKIRRQAQESGAVTSSVNVTQTKSDLKKYNRWAIFVTTAFVLAAIVVVLLTTPILYGLNALKFGDVRFTTADYKYFYSNTYSRYYSTYYSMFGESASSFMPDRETMNGYTIDAMQEAAMLVSAANAAGYTLSEEGMETVETNIQNIATTASYAGTTYRAYLRSTYGAGVTPNVFRRNVELGALASEYQEYLMGSYGYTEDDWTAYYAEHKDEYDVITYRSYYFLGEAVEDDPDTEEDETLDAETAMEIAMEQAEEFLAELEDGADFAELCYETSGQNELYLPEDASQASTPGVSLPSSYKDWLLDESRQVGDLTIAQSDTGTFVVLFENRSDNRYETVNVRHILVEPAEVSEDDYEDTADYEAAVEAANAAALEEAENLLAAWEEGDATEESFAELADLNSDDSAEGGLYSQVYLGQMEDEFDAWIFDSSRKPGDVEIVETQYGAHVIYFVGEDELYCNVLADADLIEETYDAWVEETQTSYELNGNLFYNLLCK